MNETIYLDVYFVVNTAMNYLLLSIVRSVMKLPSKKRRRLAAAAAGALWACLMVCFPVLPGWLELFVTWFGIGSGMVFLAFGSMEKAAFFKVLSSLWLASAACAGIFEILGRQVRSGYYLTGGMIPRQWSALSFVCGMAGIYFGICGCAALVKSKISEQKNLYEVTLTYQGKEKTVTALLDTGNQLYEPYGHQPVHVITYEACSQLCESVAQMIYIPFQAVGTGYGMLPGIRVDEMTVTQEGKVIRIEKQPWLAISKEPLSARKRYEMLLHVEE